MYDYDNISIPKSISTYYTSIGNVGAGEREGRVASSLVSRRHYRCQKIIAVKFVQYMAKIQVRLSTR